MTDNYDHLRTPSAYDDMIRPLLEAREAVERNRKHATGQERAELSHVRRSIKCVISDLREAHRWDGDEPRTEEGK